MNPYTLSYTEDNIPFKKLRPYINNLAKTNTLIILFYLTFMLLSDIYNCISLIVSQGLNTERSKFFYEIVIEKDTFFLALVLFLHLINNKFNFYFVGFFPALCCSNLVIQLEITISYKDVIIDISSL